VVFFRTVLLWLGVCVLAAPPAAAQAIEDDDSALQLEQPTFRLINLPTNLRLPRHKGSFDLTHRFNLNLRGVSFEEALSNLFGLDNGANIGFEFRYAPIRRLQVAAYRTNADQTIQLYAKYDGWRQRGSLPVSISAFVSVEGAENFQERYAPGLGAVVGRSFGDWASAYLTPMWVHNTAALLGEDRDTVFVGFGGRLRIRPTVYVVAEAAPRAGGYEQGTTLYGFGIEKRAGGHLFQLNFNNGHATTLANIARGGQPGQLYMGFNISRKFF
jgi:hypothetical protein